MNIKKLEREQRKINKKTASLDPDKSFGECECCGMDTVLVAEVGLCGPCCFGEADTINGNF